MDNGLQLGWLLDPESNTVEIYRAGQAVVVLQEPPSLSGKEVLEEFTLRLNGILM